MVARQTLTLFVWVRILVRLPLKTADFSAVFFFSIKAALPIRCCAGAHTKGYIAISKSSKSDKNILLTKQAETKIGLRDVGLDGYNDGKPEQ